MRKIILPDDYDTDHDYRMHTGQVFVFNIRDWLDQLHVTVLAEASSPELRAFQQNWYEGVVYGLYRSGESEPLFHTDRSYYFVHSSGEVENFPTGLPGIPADAYRRYRDGVWYEQGSNRRVCHGRALGRLQSTPSYLPRLLQVVTNFLCEDVNHWYEPLQRRSQNIENLFLDVLTPELTSEQRLELPEVITDHLLELSNHFERYTNLMCAIGTVNPTRWMDVQIRMGNLYITAGEDYRILEWEAEQLRQQILAEQAES